MAKLVMWNLMTLDGFVEGPGRDISWHNEVWGEELEEISIAQGSAAGALMFGRVTHDLMAGYWPGEKGTIADSMNALPKYVFSRTLKRSNWNNTTFFDEASPATVSGLKRDTTKDIFLFGSADLAASLVPHGLIDEFRVAVTPLLLGDGTPLFRQGERLKLKLLGAKELTNGAVILRYEPAR